MTPLLEKLISAINVAGKIPGIHLSDWSKIEYLRRLGVRYYTVSAPLVIKDAFSSQVRDFSLRVGVGSQTLWAFFSSVIEPRPLIQGGRRDKEIETRPHQET